ncbi:MAG: MFS transporter [Xanthomonadales bacterium]|nr:MFS transporter [Gammaproteobacteria bacterium]MBT8051926.1 MFS transporter [Gammaproteobacteria bacterium]MBT8055414.1 MFS transporter [Gammaproteobacteria bacterium]NNJ78790.1 MFS transporter [Xanthomonadales bacterium]NNL05406.1 MFS transporter [Xanthomonadales bacterium]
MNQRAQRSQATPYLKPAYRWYVLGLLTLVYTFNFIDRQVLVIVQEQIRDELGLMDWQLGLLSGLAFAVFYSVLGVPIAHASERFGRKRVVALSLASWSLLTALMGAAQNFAQLALLRVGVGVGEAGGSPPSHSMISDIFPRRRRALALSVFSMGVYFGYLLAYSTGGWAAETFGWRSTFVIVGLPGVLIALVLALTVREPPRGLAEHGYVAAAKKRVAAPPGFLETLRQLWSRKSFRYLALAGSLQSLAGYGVGNFMPSFIIRAHGMAIGDIGWRLALITGLGGAIAILGSGLLTDRLSERSQGWYALFPALAIALTVPLAFAVFLSAEPGRMFLAYLPYEMLGATWLGATLAVTHSLVGLRQRAVASAVLFFLVNLIGLGLGPLLIGTLSDLFRPEMGDADGLRYAMLGTAVVAKTACVIYFLRAARSLQGELAT